jgi:PAS domain S-box-containing protein
MQMMRAHRGRARQFWQVFDASPVPMTTVDNERRHLAANPAARLLFRMSLAELLERGIDDLTSPGQIEVLRELWTTLMRQGAVAGPYDVVFPDGGELRVVFCALANVLPGQHLILFAPADWPENELIETRVDKVRRPAGKLSRREREVLNLIAVGADQAQIATELTIAVPTVRTHVRNVLRKLHARNRAHAIALAMQEGVIELPARTAEE